jgi:hypothetical protein
MRIAVQAVVSDVGGQEPCTGDIGVLEYDAEAVPNSGFCFSLEPPGASNERVANTLGATDTLSQSYRGVTWWSFCGGAACIAPTSTRP